MAERIDINLPLEWDDGTPAQYIGSLFSFREGEAGYVTPHPEYLQPGIQLDSDRTGIYFDNADPSCIGYAGGGFWKGLPRLRNVLKPKPELSHIGLID